MTMNAKRIFACGVATICLSLGAAGTAVADTGTAPGPCQFGPPGQVVKLFAQEHQPPGQTFQPGQQVSACTHFFHGQDG